LVGTPSFFIFCRFEKFEGHPTFDWEEWVLDGFILGRNWQWCQLKVLSQGNIDFPIDSRGEWYFRVFGANVVGLP
jgi:hypothetical protein